MPSKLNVASVNNWLTNCCWKLVVIVSPCDENAISPVGPPGHRLGLAFPRTITTYTTALWLTVKTHIMGWTQYWHSPSVSVLYRLKWIPKTASARVNYMKSLFRHQSHARNGYYTLTLSLLRVIDFKFPLQPHWEISHSMQSIFGLLRRKMIMPSIITVSLTHFCLKR